MTIPFIYYQITLKHRPVCRLLTFIVLQYNIIVAFIYKNANLLLIDITIHSNYCMEWKHSCRMSDPVCCMTDAVETYTYCDLPGLGIGLNSFDQHRFIIDWSTFNRNCSVQKGRVGGTQWKIESGKEPL